jgi:hypothetical protein
MQQASAGGELHAEKRQPVFAYAYLVDGQNIWMIKTGYCLRFSLKADQRIA